MYVHHKKKNRLTLKIIQHEDYGCVCSNEFVSELRSRLVFNI